MKLTQNQMLSWTTAVVTGLITTIAVNRGAMCYSTLLAPANCITTAIVTVVFVGFVNIFIQLHLHSVKETRTHFIITVPLVCLAIFGMIAIAAKTEVCSKIPNPDTREVRTEYQTYYIWQLGYWTVKDTCTVEPTQ